MIISLLRKVFILSSIASLVNAGEWNQHRGPFSNNLSDESITSANWLKSTSAVVWKEKTPLGFSSFTTYEGNAFTLVAEEDEDGLMREICIALDLKTGKREWSTHLGIMDYKAGGGNSGASDNKGGDGPRSTPSVLDGKVWAYDSDMSLYCLSAKNGKLIWKVNVLKEYDGINPRWENASSPLIVDDLVIIYGGGEGKSFLAFDKDSGRLKWKTGSELATHATPILTKIHGVDQVIFFCQSGLVSILPKSGKELWRRTFLSKYRLQPLQWLPEIWSIARLDTESVRVFSESRRTEVNFPANKSGVNPMMLLITGVHPFIMMAIFTVCSVSKIRRWPASMC